MDVRECKHMEIRVQQTSTLPETGKVLEAPSACIRKHSVKSRGSLQRYSTYKIGPSSWIKKQINTNALGHRLSLSRAFCSAIGLQEPCVITLKTSMDSTESWLVHGYQSQNCSYMLGKGWRWFCLENSLMLGDICTFNIIKATLWHVVIMRSKEPTKQISCETPSASSRKHKSMYVRSVSEGQKRPKGSMISLNKASSKKGVFDIGPPAWITKKISTKAIESCIYLPQDFCKEIGIREASTITLKTPMSSTRSWQVRVLPYNYCSYHVVGSGWRRFCFENGIKAGDFCTFTIVDTTLWHVITTSLTS